MTQWNIQPATHAPAGSPSRDVELVQLNSSLRPDPSSWTKSAPSGGAWQTPHGIRIDESKARSTICGCRSMMEACGSPMRRPPASGSRAKPRKCSSPKTASGPSSCPTSRLHLPADRAPVYRNGLQDRAAARAEPRLGGCGAQVYQQRNLLPGIITLEPGSRRCSPAIMTWSVRRSVFGRRAASAAPPATHR